MIILLQWQLSRGEVQKAASEQFVFKVVALKAGKAGKCKDLGD